MRRESCNTAVSLDSSISWNTKALFPGTWPNFLSEPSYCYDLQLGLIPGENTVKEIKISKSEIDGQMYS